MNALLLISHGSRHVSGNEFVIELTRKLKNLPDLTFEAVDYAFLEFGDRPPGEVVTAWITEGVKKIVCFPLFMATGKHVTEDIPTLMDAMRQKHPQTDFVLTTHLGGVPGIEQVILDEAIKMI